MIVITQLYTSPLSMEKPLKKKPFTFSNWKPRLKKSFMRCLQRATILVPLNGFVRFCQCKFSLTLSGVPSGHNSNHNLHHKEYFVHTRYGRLRHHRWNILRPVQRDRSSNLNVGRITPRRKWHNWSIIKYLLSFHFISNVSLKQKYRWCRPDPSDPTEDWTLQSTIKLQD